MCSACPSDASAAGQDLTWFTPQVQAVLHLLLAASHLQEKDYAAADRELGRAIRIDPNNPVAVFLTGERLLADGQREAAAESLEKAAAGTQHAWVAEAIAQRVRQLRDSSAPAEPVFLSGPFLRSIIVRYLKEGTDSGTRVVGTWVTDVQSRFEAALKGSPPVSAPASQPP